MSPELFKEYAANPLAADEKVRKVLDLPDNRYYTVSMWPVEGQVRIVKPSKESPGRIVAAKKISKSDQQ